VTQPLIDVIRDSPAIVKYIDIPIQHIADPLLAAMRRETDGVYIRKMIESFRREIPGVALRTTLIVGFPGETDAHLEELAQFMKEARFERLGIFPYSPEPKTPAEKMPNPVPEKVKKERLDRLMKLQQHISIQINREWLGRELDVLIDETNGSQGVYLGRSYADAPEVDGEVHLKSAKALQPGEFVRATVVDTYEYDLVAQAL
jgi:ribosomal protein S12 methylthiotransferase